MTSLREMNIFRLRPLINNFRCKLSAITEYNSLIGNQYSFSRYNHELGFSDKQILCLVSEDNDLVLRYTNDYGVEILKLISWFKKSGRIIHDVSFDPSGTWLLVLCFDNTLHIVPALKILNDNHKINNSPFSTTEVTSFVIPFVGPHECPNSKSCPNNDCNNKTFSSLPFGLSEYVFDRSNQKDIYNKYNFANHDTVTLAMTNDLNDVKNVPATLMRDSREFNTENSTPFEDTNVGSSKNESIQCFIKSTSCPYPICVVWWQTGEEKKNRAVIGYSDGSICFVGLTPNCPFISNTAIDSGAILKLIICHDNCCENVTLLINSSTKEQWKLLLEQKSINYTFPGEYFFNSCQQTNSSRDDWQIVMPIKPNSDRQYEFEDVKKNEATFSDSTPSYKLPQRSQEAEYLIDGVKTGLLPAAKARLASLKDLGTKKILALKMKLSDNKYKLDEYISENASSTFAIMESPTMTPEILTTPAGPYFIVQNLRNTYLLSALHSYSDTLSVHSMDISLIPLFLYKIPKNCEEVIISSNILYSIQTVICSSKNTSNYTQMASVSYKTNEEMSEDNSMKKCNATGVISSAMASIRNGEEIDFNKKALLGLFCFPEETIINIHKMATYSNKRKQTFLKAENEDLQNEEIRSASSYIRYHRKLEVEEFCSDQDMEIMQNEFPEINYDPCFVVTNKNTFFIEFSNEPYVIFLNAAIKGMWNVCEEFCNTFDLSFTQCAEFAGDCLLRKRKVTQALLTYNVARLPPVRTALKLAMFGENYALMHLCAMALKSTYIIKSKFPLSPFIKYILKNGNDTDSENVLDTMQSGTSGEIVNEGKACSDYKYGVDESINSLQMSSSSQFHLSNLLLITLSERLCKEKNYMPIWNFLVINSKFHTNMTSIVLCQSGLYSAALLLAMIRGCCFDVFVGLVSVANHEFGWYSELNVLLYNLTEPIFEECITYLRCVSTDYFAILQNKLGKIEESVLQRLEKQLNPFSPVFRPIVSHLSPRRSIGELTNDNNKELLQFCKTLIETYLGILIQLDTFKNQQNSIFNALNSFRLNYEDNRFAIKLSNFSPLSAGCSHNACVIDGCAYFWGYNGVPCIYNFNKTSDPPDPPHIVKSLDILSQLNLEIHVVKCGRQHSLILTNNGLYAFGSNQLCQLGIGRRMSAALQPVLVSVFDGMNITLLEAGQYHNAAVADGQFYTWGWGIYGQLGHGNVENCDKPKRVLYFNGKKVIQTSLGHAHSLVLCATIDGSTNLYVFGSNHFGQLGFGRHFEYSSLSKSLIPLKLEFNKGNIRLIATKFFTNLIVTNKNEIYTWGSSPQALRLANQIKKRANAKQKIYDSLRKELSKRVELNKENRYMGSDSSNELKHSNRNHQDCTNVLNKMAKSNSASRLGLKENKDIEVTGVYKNLRRHSTPSESGNTSSLYYSNHSLNDSTDDNLIKMEVVQSIFNSDNVEIENLQSPLDDIDSNNDSNPESRQAEKAENLLDDEQFNHTIPQIVNSSEISGEILKISTGLFHFALITSTSLIYTWGKNLEHQLGTEDKDRKTVNKPSPLEKIENPLYVECGADFTLIMTADFVVKAFGGNSNGQCGRDLDPNADKMRSGKLSCLPTTKRFMRLEGQCVERPNDVSLPRPRIQMDAEPTSYLKNVPKFKAHYILRSNLYREYDSFTNKSTGNLQDDCQQSEYLNLNIDNLNFDNKDGLRNLSSNDISPEDEKKTVIPLSMTSNQNDTDSFGNYIHYCLYIFHGLYDPERVCNFGYKNFEYRIRIMMLNYKYVDAFNLCLTECQNAQICIKTFEYFTKDPSIIPMRRKDLIFFIYNTFNYFISKNFDLSECENFFLCDLDYYLLELSYVMYFNNRNTELEQTINSRFKDFFIQDLNEWGDYKLEGVDTIFDHLSIGFKSIICQRLRKVCEN